MLSDWSDLKFLKKTITSSNGLHVGGEASSAGDGEGLACKSLHHVIYVLRFGPILLKLCVGREVVCRGMYDLY